MLALLIVFDSDDPIRKTSGSMLMVEQNLEKMEKSIYWQPCSINYLLYSRDCVTISDLFLIAQKNTWQFIEIFICRSFGRNKIDFFCTRNTKEY